MRELGIIPKIVRFHYEQKMALRKGDVFDSYAKFELALHKYQQEDFFNTTISHSLLDANNPAIKYKSFRVKCKLHGKYDKKTFERSTKTFKQGCPFYMLVNQKRVDGGLVLEISKMNSDHNHARSADLFVHMPEQRIAVIEQTKEYIYNALDAKANYRALHKQVNATNTSKGIVTLKDLYNVKAKLSAKNDKNETDLENLLEEMLKIKDAVVKVITDGQNNLQSIFFQDGRMKSFFDAFPDVVLFDGTYKLNNMRMPLVLMLVVDGNGESQIAAFFIVRSESEQIFTDLFNEFKTENPNWGKIETIMTDKSFSNRNAFAASFPHANISLCVFHVLQIFNRQITTKKCELTIDQTKEAKQILRDMVYAKSPIEYDQSYRDLRNLRSRKLMQYFNAHWHAIQDQWVGYLVDRTKNCQIRTNNRLESLNQKIKSVVTKYANLGTFFNDVMTLFASYNTERDHVAADSVLRKPLTIQTQTADDKSYANYLTSFAYKNYAEESVKSVDVVFNQLTDITGGCLQRNIQIDTSFRDCTCRFYKTMNLPCRHIIALLRVKGQPLFNPELCADRWTRQKAQFISELEYAAPSSIPTASQLQIVQSLNTAPRTRRLTPNEKFRAAEMETKKFCELLAERPQHEFNALVQSLKKFRECVEIGKTPGKSPTHTELKPMPISKK